MNGRWPSRLTMVFVFYGKGLCLFKALGHSCQFFQKCVQTICFEEAGRGSGPAADQGAILYLRGTLRSRGPRHGRAVHTHQQLEGGAGKEGEGEAAAAVATDHLKIGSIFPNPPTVPISPSAQGGLFGGLLQKEWQAPAQRQSRDHTQHKKKG